MSFFVVLVGADSSPLPLVDKDAELCVFATENEAHTVAKDNPLAQAFGYEVYGWPYKIRR